VIMTLRPATPSNSNIPIVAGVGIDTMAVLPRVVRPVYTILEAGVPGGGSKKAGVTAGGMKRSSVLEAIPPGALNEMWPEPTDGTVIDKLVEFTPLGSVAAVVFTMSLSFCGAGSKLVPATVTELPTTAICGVNEVMVGALALVTINDDALVADPDGAVTVIVPEVAPDGTVATN